MRECSIYRREGDTWKYLKAEELKREVLSLDGDESKKKQNTVMSHEMTQNQWELGTFDMT